MIENKRLWLKNLRHPGFERQNRCRPNILAIDMAVAFGDKLPALGARRANGGEHAAAIGNLLQDALRQFVETTIGNDTSSSVMDIR